MKSLITVSFILCQALSTLSPDFNPESKKNTDLASLPTNPENCVYTYVLEAKKGLFTVSLLSNQTIAAPFNTTATAQVTLKVPTGNFKVANLKNLIEGVEFNEYDMPLMESGN